MLKEIKSEHLKRLLGNKRGAKADLARKLRCSPQYINKLCNQGGGISDDKAIMLAKALRVDVKELYRGTEFYDKTTSDVKSYRRDEFTETCYRYKDDPDFQKIVTAFEAYKRDPIDAGQHTIQKTLDLVLMMIDEYVKYVAAQRHENGTGRKPAGHPENAKTTGGKAKKKSA